MPSLSGAITTTSTDIQQAADLLKAGQLVAFPTETVYGLGADAENPEALAKLYAVKGRPTNHPVIVHLGSAAQLADWAVEIPDAAHQLAAAFWPGPLTLILKRASRVSDAVTGGQDTVGLRVPDHPVALALLQAFGGGIAAPSANRFGRLSPTTAAHVLQDLGGDVNFILDGGACDVGVESTIVAFQQGQPVVLRPGRITAAQIQAVLSANLGEVGVMPGKEQNASTVSRTPGTLASHYAPRTPLKLMSADALSRHLEETPKPETIGVLAFSAVVNPSVAEWFVMPAEADAYAQGLYASLRALDALGLSELWIEAVPDSLAWDAVRDRLSRAACQ